MLQIVSKTLADILVQLFGNALDGSDAWFTDHFIYKIYNTFYK